MRLIPVILICLSGQDIKISYLNIKNKGGGGKYTTTCT